MVNEKLTQPALQIIKMSDQSCAARYSADESSHVYSRSAVIKTARGREREKKMLPCYKHESKQLMFASVDQATQGTQHEIEPKLNDRRKKGY